jgi:polyphosphate glucokinase
MVTFRPIMRVLVLDVGGTNVKVGIAGTRRTLKFPSGPTLTPGRMCRQVRRLVADWDFDVITIGYPGPVRRGRPLDNPRNLGGGWRRFDFRAALGRPVRIINDAAMQALGSYSSGRMLFMGLGTGLGVAIVEHGRVQSLEVAHLPYRKGQSYEDVLGTRGLELLKREKWAQHVRVVVDLFRHALQCDTVVLGGGNVRKLKRLPPRTTRGKNAWAIRGGGRVWSPTYRP